jgi:flagellar biosynthesis protein FliR
MTAVSVPDVVVAAGVFVRMAVALAAGVLPVASGVCLRVQAALVLGLSVAACPAAFAAAPAAPGPAAWVLLSEAVVGLVLGLAVAAVLSAAAWAGSILGSVTGLSWADDFTPDGDARAAGLERLAWWMGLAGFFATGGHLAVVAGLVDSVISLPVGAAAGRHDGLLALAVTMPATGLALAMSLAVPALAAVVAFHLAAAVAVRTTQFDPGQGLLQSVAALVLVAAVCAGAGSWIGGFATAVQSPLERCFHELHP